MSSNTVSMPIAVVGKSVQLPSASHSPNNLDYHGLWDLLINKKEAYEDMPAERMEGISPDVPRPGGSFLKGMSKFDNIEFGVSNKDALAMTATTRRLIEMSFLALLDAGIDSRTQRVGSFMSGTNIEYFAKDFLDDRGFPMTPNTMANRVSYTLDLTGPSFYLDTACSSSLTAFHLAVRAIEAGDCDAALVGSVQYNTNLWDLIVYDSGGILSPDSKCKPFDAGANGFAKGEGGVVLVLKPLEDALRDNDHIYTVVVGSAINNNGGRASLYAPSAIGQQECIIESFRRAGKDPTDVDYVELHATGTSVGDPIECNSAGELFKREDEVVVGSFKGTFGHLEMAAFLGSMVKMCLIFEHKIVPPNANLITRNPKIFWDEYKLNAPTEAVPLPCRSSSGRSVISLAGSGIGGSNGHVVLESPPELPKVDASVPVDAPILFLVGGLSPRATSEIADSLVKLLINDSSPAALSTAVSHSRRTRQCTWRTFFTFTPGSTTAPKVENPVLVPKVTPPLVYVFTGQGPQHANMGRSLFNTHAVFRNTILDLDALYKKVVGVSLLETTGLFAGENTGLLPAVWGSDVTIPSMTMVQIALYELLSSVGVKPDALVGHSAGETALVYASGAGPKEMAFEISIARAKAMKLTETLGAGMAAFSCEASRATSLIERVSHGESGVLEIACYNLPDAVVLSGSLNLIEKAVELAQSEGIIARTIRTLNPSHSSLMDVCKDEYMRGMNDIFSRYGGPHKPMMTTYSSVGGQPTLVEEFTPEYFWANARNAVHFHQAIDTILKDSPEANFVEISPHPALSSYIMSLGVAAGSVVCTMRRPSKNASQSIDITAISETLGRIATWGINTIDLTSLYGRASRDPSYEIPYPFTTRHFPMRFDAPRELEASAGGAVSLRVKMNSKTHPELAEHTVNGEPICPGGAYIDMVLQTGAKQIWDVSFITILSLAPETPTEIRLEHEGSKWSFKSTLKRGPGSKLADEERTHLSGYLSNNAPVPHAPLDLDAIRARLPVLKMDNFYDSVRALTDYGPTFQKLVSIRGYPEETLAEVAVFPESATKKHVFHPIVMDACLHLALFHPALVKSTDKNSVFLLHRMGKFTYYDAPKGDANVWSYATMRSWTPDSRILDFTVVDATGSVLCTMQGLEMQKLSIAARSITENRYDLKYQPVINHISHPKLGAIPVPDEKEEVNTLFKALDRMAVDMISASMKEEPTFGDEPSVQQYASFSKYAMSQIVGPSPSYDVLEELRTKWPVYFELTERVAAVHKNVYKSSTTGPEALFSDDIISRFNKSQPHFAGVVEQVASTFDQLVTSIAKQGKNVLRVLEVGGSGSLAGRLTDVLKTKEDLIVEYVVSDSYLTLADVAARGTNYKWASAKAYDLTEEPEKQGLTAGTFDIITAFNALHVADVPSTLSSLQRLLVPGGSLLMAEIDGSVRKSAQPGSIWLDTVFGTLPGWFNTLLTADQWKSSLSSTGYLDIQTSTDSSNGLELIFAAQSPSFTPVAAPIRPKNTVFVPFKYGKEMAVQESLAKLDINDDMSVWLLANDGVDGDAAVGLTRCLVIEMNTWKVHLAVFEGMTKESAQIDAILGYRQFIEDENIVRFAKNGEPYLPKLAPTPPPAPAVKFDPTGTWAMEGSEIVQTSLAPLAEYQVAIEVSSWSEALGSFRGFAGVVIESMDSNFTAGQTVVGISELPLSNRIVSHAGLMTAAPKNSAKLAGDVLAILIGTLALGPTRLTRSVRSPPLDILATDMDVLGKTLGKFCSNISSIGRLTFGQPLLKASDKIYDIVISDSATLAAKPEIAPMGTKLFVWDTLVREMVKIDPYSVGYALEAGLQISSPSAESTVIYPRDLVRKMVGSLVSSNVPLFSANKAYILIGGMSDVGIHASTWMYKNGARHIVLTSRRGMRFIEENEFVPTTQKFKYLKSLKDLDLRVEAADAASFEATAAVVKNIKQPIGGCLLMTLVLSDGLFMRHTEETYNKVFDAKVKAVQALNAAIPITSLDFFVFFSSITTILGNNGQGNYTSANTVVDGMLSKYDNAFSLVPCGILQIGSVARLGTDSWDYERLERWSITPDEVCESLGQGLAKLSRGEKFNRFVPDLNWNIIEKDVGLSTCARHLATYQGIDGGDKKQDLSELLDTILSIVDVSIEDFSKEVPFTAYGLDSLGAMRLTEAIRPYTNVSQMQLLGGMTWKQLEEKMKVDEVEEPEAPSTQPMLDAVAKYSKDFPVHKPSAPAPKTEAILLTGSTGAVGSSALTQLVDDPAVSKIYAVNRRSSDGKPMKQRQKDSLVERGFDASYADSPKVVLLEADFSKPDFGFQPAILEEIRSSITHIAHIAWQINLTVGLDAYEADIQGARYLIDLALSSPLPTPPRFLFTSSISILHKYTHGVPVPEAYIEPEVVAPGRGYDHAKWVIEKVLELASNETPLRPIVFRVGQVVGGSNGFWKNWEWLPSIVQTGKTLGCLPFSEQRISWVPLPLMSAAIVEMRSSDVLVADLVHPNPISWNTVFNHFSKLLNVPLVPYAEWLQKLEDQLTVPDCDLHALRLLSMYRNIKLEWGFETEATLANVANENSKNGSPSLGNAAQLTTEDADRWMNYWRSIGFISY